MADRSRTLDLAMIVSLERHSSTAAGASRAQVSRMMGDIEHKPPNSKPHDRGKLLPFNVLPQPRRDSCRYFLLVATCTLLTTHRPQVPAKARRGDSPRSWSFQLRRIFRRTPRISGRRRLAWPGHRRSYLGMALPMRFDVGPSPTYD